MTLPKDRSGIPQKVRQTMQPYELIRSGRRTLALEVRGGRVIVRAPYRTSKAAIDRFVAAHTDWIARALTKQEARAAAHPEPTDAEREKYIRRAKDCLPQRVAYYAERMGLYPTQVRITGARTRFGSCSSQGHICFSWRLMQYPPEAIDYVVVHELAHLRYMNHGAEFYALIARYLPDWKARCALLRA